MRVSTSQIFNIANISMAKAQAAVTRTQEQISTGKRVLSPADDPIAATSILMMNQQLARLEQYNKNIDIAENNLNMEEVALTSIMNLVHRMKEIAVAAGNTTVLSAADYRAMAAEVEIRIEELLNLQNSRNTSGQYLFGGYQGNTQPFVQVGEGNYRYQGDEGQLRLQASDNVKVAVNDSGKRVFVDIPASHNTFITQASPANQGSPPARISVGQVVNQEAFDEFYPEDLLVTFNALAPTGTTYTVTESSTGRVLIDNEPYVSGEFIEVAGTRFMITGNPYAGEPAVPATLPFTFGAAEDFSAAPATLTLTVGGVTETLVLDQNVTNVADLVAALSATADNVPGSGAERNADKLANLGLVVGPGGLTSASGHNITIANGTAATDNVTGLATQGAGTTSTDGVPAEPGDRFTLRATDKQGLLTTLSRLSEAMRNVSDNPESKAELARTVARVLGNLDNAVNHLATVQGEVGARLNTLDSSREQNLDTELYGRKVLSQLEDLDYAEAASRLAMESLVLSAAQQSFAKVSQLTLFNYL